MSDRIKDKNETIRIPEDGKLTTSDGRVFSVVDWKTESSIGEMSIVTCTMRRMDERKQQA